MELTDSIGTFLLTLIVVFLSLVYYINRNPRNFPPGPLAFPIVGNVMQLGSEPHKHFMRLREKYGDIFSVKLGSFPTVVINGRENLCDAMVTMKNTFAGRPPFAIKDFTLDSTSFQDIGDEWSWKKKQIVKGLGSIMSDKDFNFNDILQMSQNDLIDDFAKQNGEAFDPYHFQYLAALCVGYRLLFDKGGNIRECGGKYDFKRIMESQKDFSLFAHAGNVYNVIPWLKKIWPWGYAKVLDHNSDFVKLTIGTLNILIDTFVAEHTRGITDCFLAVNSGSPEARQKLLFGLPELLAASFDSSATTILWTYSFLVNHEHVQRMVQEAIDQTVGQARVSLEDRKRLPIVDAVILEAMRLELPIPLGIPKLTLEDCVFKGFVIPKGTVVLTNYFSVNYDQTLWDNVDEFIPERFLKDDGTLNHEKERNVFAFGMGQRKCPGEFVGRAQLFIALANILQRFTLKKVPGENYNLTGVAGLMTSPPPFKIIAEDRSMM